ncbi:MAG: FAD:protein FMN transferase [Bacteroidota bacterium]|nr:FAD:protein FMN transferase [Bacteroidota bacterium]
MRYLLIFLICLVSCSIDESSKKSVLVINKGNTQGTYYYIKYLSINGQSFQTDIDSILNEIDLSLSIYNNNSLISNINSGDSVNTDFLFNTVFDVSKEINEKTNGAFDPSISPLVNYWGFYNYTGVKEILVDSTEINNILKNIGFGKIKIKNNLVQLPTNMSLDFNSIAQGYTVDLIGSYLRKVGVNDFLINVGGENLASGKNQEGDIWKIGIEKPTNKINDDYKLILSLNNKAIATSGNYRKFHKINGKKYSHVIDPLTGYPAYNRLLSVSVIHDDCMIADAYATAFMVMGVKKTKDFIKKNKELQVFLIYSSKENEELETYISPSLNNSVID